MATPTPASSGASATRPAGHRGRRVTSVFLILLSLLVVGCMVVSLRRTYVSRLLDDSGVRVHASVTSVFHEASGGGSGPRGRGRGAYTSLGDVAYAFDYGGRHFSDTARDVQLGPLRANERFGRVEATVLPYDPDLHRLETGYRRREWSDTFGGCAVMGVFATFMGAMGVALWHPEPSPPPAPPAEFFTRLEPFLERAPPRGLRWRWSTTARTVVFTALVLIPPAYAAVKWHEYLEHWTPRESIWPWSWGTMLESVAQGIPYFLLALPAYVLRFARMYRVARLARRGRVTVGVVDWKLKKSRAKPKAVIKINGSAVNSLPDFKEDWVPYRYEVDGRSLTAESADGRPPLSRSISTPVAAYLPTGRQVLVLYDPHRPEESVLVAYAKYYLDFSGEDAAVAPRPAL